MRIISNSTTYCKDNVSLTGAVKKGKGEHLGPKRATCILFSLMCTIQKRHKKIILISIDL